MSYNPSTGTVDFSEALMCLKRGGKLVRRYWQTQGHEIFIKLTDDGIGPVYGMFNRETGTRVGRWQPDTVDTLAMDWEELP